jgi:hypothetical protein
MSVTRISASLEPSLARKVAAVQRRTGKSVTDIVKESIETYCDTQLSEAGSTLDALMATGFVGCAEGPEDLSERYKTDLASSLEGKA